MGRRELSVTAVTSQAPASTPAPIEVAFDVQRKTLNARLDTRLVVPVAVRTFNRELVLLTGEVHAKVIQCMVETIKGSLEPGERPYHRRVFGLWPSRIWHR